MKCQNYHDQALEKVRAILDRRAGGDRAPLTDQDWLPLAQLAMRRDCQGMSTRIMCLMGLENYQMLRGFRKGFAIGQRCAAQPKN